MTKKCCVHEVATKKPLLDKLADDYVYALDRLQIFEEENAAIMEYYMGLQNKVQHFRIALEAEAKECAKVGLVDYDSKRLHVYIQRRSTRRVDPGILHMNTSKGKPIGVACADMVKISVTKLDEYVEQGIIPKNVYDGYVQNGEPEMAFHLKEKPRP